MAEKVYRSWRDFPLGDRLSRWLMAVSPHPLIERRRDVRTNYTKRDYRQNC